MKLEDDGSITTYDCFTDVREELAQLEARVLPPIVSALTCVLNEPSRYVALRKLARASCGRLDNGTLIHDIRIEGRAVMHTSYSLPAKELAEKLAMATAFALSLNPRAARFFALGLAEEDQLKRFLYFFLALEVETHAVFGRIDHAASTRALVDGSGLLGKRSAKLLQAQVEGLKNLFDRFVWCAACVWTKLEESDIVQFKILKDARDDIAHGRASEPPVGFAREAERLAHKVLWSGR
jgi:hypothetical protein